MPADRQCSLQCKPNSRAFDALAERSRDPPPRAACSHRCPISRPESPMIRDSLVRGPWASAPPRPPGVEAQVAFHPTCESLWTRRQPDPTGDSPMANAKPLSRYGAIWRRFASGFARPRPLCFANLDSEPCGSSGSPLRAGDVFGYIRATFRRPERQPCSAAAGAEFGPARSSNRGLGQ